MKRFISLLLVFALLLGVALASGGDPNIGGEGGDTGEGSTESWWRGGDDGVRVSIVQGTTVIRTFDLANKNWRDTIQRCFSKTDKLTYKRTQIANIVMDYENYVPEILLPRIIPASGGSNIDAIKDYFTDRQVVEYIAEKAGMAYDQLTNGDYKIMLEPMAYFMFKGKWWAMSATEVALYDVEVSGALRYDMWSLTHQNQPLCMFLERDDLGIQAWRSCASANAGATSGRQSNVDILNYLGVGLISFFDDDLDVEPPAGVAPPGEPLGSGWALGGSYDYVYRTDTDVVTSVLITNNLGRDMTPESWDYVTFNINGTTYSKQVVCPEGRHQLVWVKWHTPRTEQEIRISVSQPGGFPITLNVAIMKLEEKTPPDPGYDGPGVGPGITGTKYQAGFVAPATRSWGSNTSTSWSQWIAEKVWYWEENWVWVPDEHGTEERTVIIGGVPTVERGDWEDQGDWAYYWDFSVANYTASLSVDFELVPDARVPTAERRSGRYIMGSGYGVDAICEVSVTGTSTSDVTRIQNVLAVFPEFTYDTYDRLLTPDRNAYRTTWGFKSNPYSYYGEPVHFTPVWYPDGNYTVQVAAFDAWTPGGMLYAVRSDSVTISGTMYDDWYIRSY